MEHGSNGCHNQNRSKSQGKRKVKCYHFRKQGYVKKLKIKINKNKNCWH